MSFDEEIKKFSGAFSLLELAITMYNECVYYTYKMYICMKAHLLMLLGKMSLP